MLCAHVNESEEVDCACECVCSKDLSVGLFADPRPLGFPVASFFEEATKICRQGTEKLSTGALGYW
jgi:hypothetical protein